MSTRGCRREVGEVSSRRPPAQVDGMKKLLVQVLKAAPSVKISVKYPGRIFFPLSSQVAYY